MRRCVRDEPDRNNGLRTLISRSAETRILGTRFPPGPWPPAGWPPRRASGWVGRGACDRRRSIAGPLGRSAALQRQDQRFFAHKKVFSKSKSARCAKVSSFQHAGFQAKHFRRRGTRSCKTPAWPGRRKKHTRVLTGHGGVIASAAGISWSRERPVSRASESARRTSSLRSRGEMGGCRRRGRSTVERLVAGVRSMRWCLLFSMMVFGGETRCFFR